MGPSTREHNLCTYQSSTDTKFPFEQLQKAFLWITSTHRLPWFKVNDVFMVFNQPFAGAIKNYFTVILSAKESKSVIKSKLLFLRWFCDCLKVFILVFRLAYATTSLPSAATRIAQDDLTLLFWTQTRHRQQQIRHWNKKSPLIGRDKII